MSKWISVEHELPKGKVLVIFLEASFGVLTPETTTAYYDAPEDYQDAKDARGWVDWYTNKPLLVTHWMRLPDVAKTLFGGMRQKDFNEKFGTMRPNLGSVYEGMGDVY